MAHWGGGTGTYELKIVAYVLVKKLSKELLSMFITKFVKKVRDFVEFCIDLHCCC